MAFLNLGMALVILACKTGFLAAGATIGRLTAMAASCGFVLLLATPFRPGLALSDRGLLIGYAGAALLLIYLGWIKAGRGSRLLRALLFAPYAACLVLAGMGMSPLVGRIRFAIALSFVLGTVLAGLLARRIPGAVNVFDQSLRSLGLIMLVLVVFFPGATRAFSLPARPLAVEMDVDAAPLQLAVEIPAEALKTAPPEMMALILAGVSVIALAGYVDYRLHIGGAKKEDRRCSSRVRST
ncbi:MAG: hypothetical protein ACUVTQ_08120 [Desulfotomaculales bacterium]